MNELAYWRSLDYSLALMVGSLLFASALVTLTEYRGYRFIFVALVLTGSLLGCFDIGRLSHAHQLNLWYYLILPWVYLTCLLCVGSLTKGHYDWVGLFDRESPTGELAEKALGVPLKKLELYRPWVIGMLAATGVYIIATQTVGEFLGNLLCAFGDLLMSGRLYTAKDVWHGRLAFPNCVLKIKGWTVRPAIILLIMGILFFICRVLTCP